MDTFVFVPSRRKLQPGEAEDDSAEFIPIEFIPMGPAGFFRSRPEEKFRLGTDERLRSRAELLFRSRPEDDFGPADGPTGSSRVSFGSSRLSGTKLLSFSSSAVQRNRYTLVLRRPRWSVLTSPARSNSFT